MFSKFMYLETHRQKMLKHMKTSSPFQLCIKSFLGCKGFISDDHHYLPHPLDAVPGKLYLVQIMSHLNDLMDNRHCIVIYNGKLYDIHHTTPLSLTQKNLDSCCVGSEWKFHHVSRVKVFLPTKTMKIQLTYYENQWELI
jgi:hypothetical protein